jgi:RHS repeat-associated protein
MASPSPTPLPSPVQSGSSVPGQPYMCQSPCPGGCGAVGVPRWSLNLFSLNLVLSDTPAFYTPGLGPRISWDLTFNSYDPNAVSSPFNYLFGAGIWCPYLTNVIDLGSQVNVIMPDGREDYYYPVNPNSNPIVYNPASGSGIYNQLTKNTTTNQFQLVLKDHSVLTFGKQFTSGGTSYYAVTQIADKVGNAVTLAYTSGAVPKLSTITDANGKVSQVVYNSAGQASQINDPFGANVQFSYTSVGGLTRLASITDQAGYTSLLGYDSSGRLISLTTPLTSPNPTWQFAYSGSTTQISSIIGPDGKTTTYSMTSTTTTVTDPLGRKTTYDFSNNSFGGAGTITDALGNSTQQQFDSNRNVIRLINARGYFSDYTYDSQGNRLTEKDYLNPYPDTSQYVNRSWTYDSNNNVLSATDPAGTENWTYNANNQVLTDTDKLGHTTSYAYTSQGLLQTVTDRNGIVAVTNSYDSNGRLISTADALGNTTKFQWDSRGRETAVTDPDGNTTSFSYDLLDRVTVTTFPDSTTIQNSYNCCTLTQTTDQKGGTIQFVYDDYNRLIKRTDQTGAVVQQAYDAVGNLVSLTDPNNHTWQWQYDVLNRRIKEIDPLGNQRSWTYDAVGNMASRTDGKKATTKYSYDALNRLTQTSYPDNTSVTMTYDAVGNRLTLTSSAGQWSWTYDALGRVTSEQTPAASAASQFQYDNEGHRTAVIDPDGNQTSYVYDHAYRLSSVTFPVGSQNLTVSYQYNGRSLVTARALPNGVQSGYNYDSLGRPTQIKHSQSGGTVLTQLAYQYDAAGNPTSETGLRWDTSSGTTFPYQAQYGYDARQELTSEKYYVNNSLNLELDYTYDAAGNRSSGVTTIPGSSDSPVTVDSTYQADNQIASAVRTAPQDPTQTTTYSEDANGNLTAQAAPSGTTSYSYDFENRLTNVALPSGSNVQFVYNGDGLRLQKTGVGGVVTKYVLDQLNVLLEKNASGATTVRYVPGVARIAGTDVRYYLEDRMGSVLALVDSTQTVTDTFRYDAWGNLLAEQGSTATPYQWIGDEAYYLNADIGLYLLGLRFYSSMLGRFITRDPIGFDGDINLYRYVGNSPLNGIDPSGQQWYGNFCGPNSPPGPPAGPRPIDALDACCLAHDRCYARAGARWWRALPGCSTPATRRCDAALCRCARRAGCAGWRCRLARRTIMAIFC